jgi:uncharacterized protein YecE (DUF72 family)
MSRKANNLSPTRGVFLGTAGWSIPGKCSGSFPCAPSRLESYAQVFNAVEINSTFYQRHEEATFARWHASVPDYFRFALKMPREISHERRLVGCRQPLRDFLVSIAPLEEKLGPLLLQLPPSLAYNARQAAAFFKLLRELHAGSVACEPRHASWFTPQADSLLAKYRIARAAADPVKHPRADEPGGWLKLVYCRLHGSPRMYYSAYSERYLSSLAAKLRDLSNATLVWCVFDNTASGAAAENALHVRELLVSKSRQ